MSWRVLLMSLIRRGNLMKMYRENLRLQYEGDAVSISADMRRNAVDIFRFHVENNAAYRKFLDDKGFDYSDLDNIVWEDVPFITKDDLRKYYPEVTDEIYNYSSSGGSTSAPFRYPASKDSALFTWPSHWMLHNEFGVKPFSPMLMLMAYGEQKKSVSKKIYHYISNFTTFNSFTMNEEQMREMCMVIKKKNIEFIYGYSSSINLFLRFLRDNDIHLRLNGIVTTSDNRIRESYALAQDYCGCDVYDQYGAHDGDVFGFECKEHNGLHINHRYSTVEIIDGEIILTAIRNKAFPFIRYRVGDFTTSDTLITEKCSCGRTLFRLKSLDGRNTYFIKNDDGSTMSIILFSYPFDADFDILQYQVYEKAHVIYVNFITDFYTIESLEEKYMPFVSGKINREVRFVRNGELFRLKNGKLPLYINLDKQ